MQCDLCNQPVVFDSLCEDHLKMKNLGEIEKCTVCHKRWAKMGYACGACWDEELKVLGELHD